MSFRVEIKFAMGFDVVHEFSEDFSKIDSENIDKATLWAREKLGTFNLRGILFVIFPEGPEYEMTFNCISPYKKCTIGGLTVPAHLYRTRTLSDAFHERLTNLRIEHNAT